MERVEAERMHETLRGELRSLDTQIDALTDRAEAVRMLLTGFERLFPDLLGGAGHEETEAEGKPRTIRDGLAAIFDLHPDRWFSTSEVVDELHARGWLPESNDPESAVRAALRRMLRHDEVVRRSADGRSFQYRKAEPGLLDQRNGDGPASVGPSPFASSPSEEGGDADDDHGGGHHHSPLVEG